MSEQDSNPYRVQAVDRAIDLLVAFTQEEPELPLAELARRTGLTKPTAFRLLATMQSRGLISQSMKTGAYSLGSEITALAAIRARQSALLDRALPIMRRIREEVNETTSLAIRVGDHRVHLYQLESMHPIRRTTEIGDRSPLYAGAANRVLLAAMDDAEIAAYLQRTPLTPFTPRTTVDPERIWKEVARIRRQGYAESRGERHPGGVGMAAPVRDATSAVVAVLYVSVPEDRYTKDLRQTAIASVTRGAAELSKELGFRAQPTSSSGDRPTALSANG